MDWVPLAWVHAIWGIAATIGDSTICSSTPPIICPPCEQCLPWPNGTSADGTPWQMARIPVVSFVADPALGCKPCNSTLPVPCPELKVCSAVDDFLRSLPFGDEVLQNWLYLLGGLIALILFLAWLCFWPCRHSRRTTAGNGSGGSGGGSDGDNTALTRLQDEHARLTQELARFETVDTQLRTATEALNITNTSNKDLQDQLDGCRKHGTGLQAQLDAVMEELRFTKVDNNALEDNLEKCAKHGAELQAKIEADNLNAQEAQADLEKHTADLDELVKVADVERKELEEELTQCRENGAKLRLMIDKDYENSKKTQAALQEEIEGLNGTVDVANGEYEQLGKALKQCQEHSATLQSQLDANNQIAQNTKAGLKKQITSFQGTVKAANDEKENLKSALAQCQERSETQRNTIDADRRIVKEAQKSDEKFDSAERELTDANKEHRRLVVDLVDHSNKIEYLTKELHAVKDENKKVKDALKDCKEMGSQLQHVINSAPTQPADSQADCEAKLKKVVEDLAQATVDKDHIKKALEACKQHGEHLKAQMDAAERLAEETQDSCDEKLSTMGKAVRTTIANYNDITGKHKAEQAVFDAAKGAEIEELKEALRIANADNESLRSQLEDFDAHAKQLQEQKAEAARDSARRRISLDKTAAEKVAKERKAREIVDDLTKKRIEKLQEDLAKSQAALESKQSGEPALSTSEAFEKCEEERQGLKERLNKIYGNHQALLQQAKKGRAKIESLEIALNEAQEATRKAVADQKSNGDESSDLHAQCKFDQEKLQSQLDHVHTAKDAADRKVEELHNSIDEAAQIPEDDITEDKTAVDIDLAKCREDGKKLEEELSAARTAQTVADGKIEELRAQIEEAGKATQSASRKTDDEMYESGSWVPPAQQDQLPLDTRHSRPDGDITGGFSLFPLKSGQQPYVERLRPIDDLEKCRGERERLKYQLNEANEMLRLRRQEIQDLRTFISDLKSKNDTLRVMDLQYRQQGVGCLKCMAKNDEHSARGQDTMSRLERCQAELTDMTRTADAADIRTTVLKDDIERLQKSNQEAKTAANDEIARVSEKLRIAQDALAYTKEALKDSLQAASESPESPDASKKSRTPTKSRSAYEEDCRRAHEKCDEAVAELGKLKEKVEKAEKERSDAEANIKQTQQSLEGERRIAAELGSELTKARAATAAAERNAKGATAKLKAARENLATTQSSLQECQDERSAAMSTKAAEKGAAPGPGPPDDPYADVKAELNKAQEKVKQLEQEAIAAEKESAAIKKEADNKCQKLEQDAVDAADSYQFILQERDEAEKDAADLRDAVRRLEKKLAATMATSDESSDDVREQLRKALGDNENFKNRISMPISQPEPSPVDRLSTDFTDRPLIKRPGADVPAPLAQSPSGGLWSKERNPEWLSERGEKENTLKNRIGLRNPLKHYSASTDGDSQDDDQDDDDDDYGDEIRRQLREARARIRALEAEKLGRERKMVEAHSETSSTIAEKGREITLPFRTRDSRQILTIGSRTAAELKETPLTLTPGVTTSQPAGRDTQVVDEATLSRPNGESSVLPIAVQDEPHELTPLAPGSNPTEPVISKSQRPSQIPAPPGNAHSRGRQPVPLSQSEKGDTQKYQEGPKGGLSSSAVPGPPNSRPSSSTAMTVEPVSVLQRQLSLPTIPAPAPTASVEQATQAFSTFAAEPQATSGPPSSAERPGPPPADVTETQEAQDLEVIGLRKSMWANNSNKTKVATLPPPPPHPTSTNLSRAVAEPKVTDSSDPTPAAESDQNTAAPIIVVRQPPPLPSSQSATPAHAPTTATSEGNAMSNSIWATNVSPSTPPTPAATKPPTASPQSIPDDYIFTPEKPVIANPNPTTSTPEPEQRIPAPLSVAQPLATESKPTNQTPAVTQAGDDGMAGSRWATAELDEPKTLNRAPSPMAESERGKGRMGKTKDDKKGGRGGDRGGRGGGRRK